MKRTHIRHAIRPHTALQFLAHLPSCSAGERHAQKPCGGNPVPYEQVLDPSSDARGFPRPRACNNPKRTASMSNHPALFVSQVKRHDLRSGLEFGAEGACEEIYTTPRIQPSTWAMVRSCDSRAGLKNRCNEPFASARRSQEAAAYAACWSALRSPSFAKRRVQSDGYTSATTERPCGISQPSKGQKCTCSRQWVRRYRSHGKPAWVDVAT